MPARHRTTMPLSSWSGPQPSGATRRPSRPEASARAPIRSRSVDLAAAAHDPLAVTVACRAAASKRHIGSLTVAAALWLALAHRPSGRRRAPGGPQLAGAQNPQTRVTQLLISPEPKAAQTGPARASQEPD